MRIKTKVIATKLMPEGRFVAITLFGIVFTRKKDNIDRYMLNHELIHCCQQLEWLYLPFFVLYVGEWIWHLLRLRSLDAAYRAISFEREAYDHERDLEYLSKRRFFANYRGIRGEWPGSRPRV